MVEIGSNDGILLRNFAQRGVRHLGLAPSANVAQAALDRGFRTVCRFFEAEAARESGASVSLATIYNTLRAFCDVGLMQEVTVDGSKSYFDTNPHDHPHFYWEDEGRLSDAPSDELVITRL